MVSPARLWRYAALALRGAEPRHVGHNPAGGWMIVALLALAALAAASGWLYVTDRFWGEEWVERVHAVSAWLLVALVPVHVAGVLVASWRHRENLVGAMVHGRKRAAGKADVD